MRLTPIPAICSVAAIVTVSYLAYQGHQIKTQKAKYKSVVLQKAVGSSGGDRLQSTTTHISDSGIVSFNQNKQQAGVTTNKTTKKPHPERNEFVYEPTNSKAFTAKQGTQIWIPDHAFVDAVTGAPIPTTVDIKIEEYYAMDDILLKDLHTMSDQGLLETNGMIHISASANGRECKLKESKAVSIGFPMVNNKPDMQLFWKEENDIDAVWRSAKFSASVRLTPPADGVEIPPSLSNGLTSLKQYIQKYIERPVDNWHGKMEIEIFVSPWGATDSVKVLNEINDDATALVGVALKKLTWKKGFKHQIPASFRARLQFEYVRDRGLSKIKFTQPFTYAPYQPLLSNSVRQFTSPTLGWINCDRFYFFTKKTDFKVNISDDSFRDVKIVFDNYKAILNGKSEKDGYAFNNVPENEPITVIAIKKENGKYLLAQQSSNTSAGSLATLEYVSVTKEQLRTALLNLDRISKPQVTTTAMR